MKVWLRLFALLLVGILLASAAVFVWVRRPLHLPAQAVEFTIAPGTTMRGIANRISEAGVPTPPLLLNLIARVRGQATRLKAGTYRIEAGATPITLLDKIEKGDVLQLEVLIAEGLNFEQTRAVIAANSDLNHTAGALSNAELLRSIDASEASPEGLFSPATYRFPRGTSDLDIYRQAYAAQRKRLAEAWQDRSPTVPYSSPYEALIVASIIEKETGNAEDRAHVAAVFVNRLRQGKPLQSDPTVIYGLGKSFEGNLRKRDLTTDTAYNTYTRTGLPPTPISMPGSASLIAALNPADSKAIFFVARGDGTSEFSDKLADHNRAVNTYQRARKQ